MKFQKLKRWYALALAATIAAGGFSTAGPIFAAETGVTIKSVSYGNNYVETHATDDDTINSPSASTNIVSVELSDGTKIDAQTYGDAQGVLTLVADGVQYDILDYLQNKEALPEGYSFESTAGSVTYTEPAKFGNMGGQMSEYTYRSALKVVDGEVVENETITALLKNVKEYSATALKDGSLKSAGAFFNGVIVDSKEAADFTIKNMDIDYIGDGANDFQGEGAAILAQGKATINIQDTNIHTAGVIRTAAAAKENGVLKIDDSVIYTEESKDTNEEYTALVVPMMKRTPFALGMEGVVRATNILGSSQGIYTDSLIVSSGWGVLSTDSGTAYEKAGTYALDVDNVIAGVGSVEEAQAGKTYTATFTQDMSTEDTSDDVVYGFTQEGSGYVAYADSGVWDRFNNVQFFSDDYIQIAASNTSSAYYTNSVLKSGRIAFMTQQNAGGLISVKDSTVDVEDTLVQIKSGAANKGYTNVEIDNTQVNLGSTNKWGGTLVELVESDDAGNPGVTEYKINDIGDQAESGAAEIADSNATLKNGTYNGNIWNNIYNNTEALNVTLDNATVNGTISSSYGYHLVNGKRAENGVDTLYAYQYGDYRGNTTGDYASIGALYNVANEQINNPVNLTLTNNSTYNVVLADGTNGEAAAIYLNDISVEAGSKLTASTPVTVYYYGEKDIKGTVSENITFEKATVKAAAEKADDGVIADFQLFDGTKVQAIAKDEEGNLLSKAATLDYAISSDRTSFDVTAAEGYEIVSVTASENGIIGEGGDGKQYGISAVSGNNQKLITVNILVKAAATVSDADTIAELQKKLEDAEAQNADLTSQLATANSKVTSLTSQLSDVKAKLTAANSKITTLTSQITSLKSQLTTANKKITTLTSQITSLKSQLTTANKKIANLEATVKAVLTRPTATLKKVKTGINVSWTKSQGATGYAVFRSTSKDSGYSRIITVKSTTTSYTDKTAKAGKTYYYKVIAYRTVNGKNIYGPYSTAKAIKR